MRLFSALAFVGMVATGCSPSTTISSVGSSPAGSVSPGLISVPVGVVLGFEAQSDTSGVVTASIDDPTAATVTATTEASKFVVIGLAQGQTTIHVFAGGHETNRIAVEVTPVALDVTPADASIPSESGPSPFDPSTSP